MGHIAHLKNSSNVLEQSYKYNASRLKKCYYPPNTHKKKGGSPPLNKSEFPSPKNASCQVWVKLLIDSREEDF